MAERRDEHAARVEGPPGDGASTWGPKLFIAAAAASALFFWWLLIHSGGATIVHG